MHKILTCLFAILFSAAASANKPCNDSFSDAELLTLKSDNFDIASEQKRNQTAVALLACIGHNNPAIRDGVVYAAYQYWLRNELLTTETVQHLLASLFNNLKQSEQDPEQFRTAFSALILSEVIRVDRQKPYMTQQQRQLAINETAHFMANINDYRGFTDNEGWRHSVAHTADIILQFSLNKAVSPSQGQVLLTAIAQQVAPPLHYYHFGEPKRLALPTLYLLLNDKVSHDNLNNMLQQLASPAPFPDWQATYQSEHGLAKRHNTRSFFEALFVLSSNSQNPKLQVVNADIADMLKALG